MVYFFEPITWDDRLAFNATDCTIRIEAKDDIPWGEKKWQTTNCCIRKAGTQKQIWDEDKKELAWIKTPDVVFFGGLSTEEQEALVPIVARGLPALLIKASRRNDRGRWYIENETEICNCYQKRKEDGVPFDDSELKIYRDDIGEMFTEDSARIMANLPKDLYEIIEQTIRKYIEIDVTIEHSSVEMRMLINCETEKETREVTNAFITNVNKSSSLVEIGRQISKLPLKNPNKKNFVRAMYKSKLFDTKGKDENQYYKSVSEGF